jgi:hypothetical protein
MTMTTIGYGDVLPSTLPERLFVSAAMFFGAFQYGYIIGAVSNIITTRNLKTNRFYQLMSELNAFLEEGKFKVGRCRLTLSKPVLKAPMFSALGYNNMMKRLIQLLSNSTCATTSRRTCASGCGSTSSTG